MKATSLKGMSVVSINEGQRLGTIDDLLVDPQARRIAAAVVPIGAASRVLPSLDERTKIISFDDVCSIGNDAVTVESAKPADKARRQTLDGLPSLHDVIGLKVVDAAGTLLGRVDDLEFDVPHGQITELVVQSGGVLGVGGSSDAIPAAAIHSLGPDLVMVAQQARATKS
jgi:sporulation protein YlmC with PRC-barrel domain